MGLEMSGPLLAKKIIVEIIRHLGGSITGVNKLDVAFYLAHLFYAKSEIGYLSDWPIVRLPHGPGVDEGEVLLAELVGTGILNAKSQSIGPYEVAEYSLSGKDATEDPLAPEAVTAIKKAAASSWRFNAVARFFVE